MPRIIIATLLQLILHSCYAQTSPATWNGDGEYLPGKPFTEAMKKMGAEKKLIFDINATGNVTGNLITTYRKTKMSIPVESGDQLFTVSGNYDAGKNSLLLVLTHLKTKPDHSDALLTFKNPDSVYYDLSSHQQEDKTVITGTPNKILNRNTTVEWVGAFNGGGLGKHSENISMHVLPLRIKFENAFKLPQPNMTEAVVRKDTAAVIVPKRRIDIQRTIILDTSFIKIDLYDNGEIDGDKATLILDGKTILNQQLLTAKAATISLELSKDKSEHLLQLFADNMGSIPPNTAVLILTCRNKRFEINLSSNEMTNGSVKLIFR